MEMKEWIMYLVKSGLALWLFYGIYWLFLRKETYFSVNRFILLGSVVLSFILPLVPLSDWIRFGENQELVSGIFINLETAITSSVTPDPVYTIQPVFLSHWSNWLLLGYMAGIMMLLSRLVWQWIQIIKMRNRSQLSIRDGMKVALVKTEISPFSWFNFIFINHSLPPEEDLLKIVKHEKAHYIKFHYIDLLVIGLTGLIQWFNPVMWFFDRSIREIHEFEADREVLRWNPNVGRYQALLVNQITGLEVFRLANGFSKSLTKKRMIMMTKLKSKKIALIKVFLLIPVLTLLFYAFREPIPQNKTAILFSKETISGTVSDDESGEPLPGAAVIIAGTTTGTVTDLEGKFKLEVENMDVTLVFSFVGYKTLKIPLKGKHVIEAKMVRDIVEIKSAVDEKDDTDKQLELKKKEEQKKKEELKKKQEMAEEKTSQEKGDEEYTGDGETFVIVEEMPSFQGGGTEAFAKYIQEQVIKHKVAEKTGLSGTVVMEFTVTSQGKVTHIKVAGSSGQPELDDTASKLVTSSPDWQPGKQRGKNVAVQFKIPVIFK